LTCSVSILLESEEHDINPSRKDIRAKQSEELDKDNSWKDLLDNPVEWWDLRSTEVGSFLLDWFCHAPLIFGYY